MDIQFNQFHPREDKRFFCPFRFIYPFGLYIFQFGLMLSYILKIRFVNCVSLELHFQKLNNSGKEDFYGVRKVYDIKNIKFLVLQIKINLREQSQPYERPKKVKLFHFIKIKVVFHF